MTDGRWDDWSATEAAQARAAEEDEERRAAHEVSYLRLIGDLPPEEPKPVPKDSTRRSSVAPSTDRPDPPGWNVYHPPVRPPLTSLEGLRAWAREARRLIADDER